MRFLSAPCPALAAALLASAAAAAPQATALPEYRVEHLPFPAGAKVYAALGEGGVVGASVSEGGRLVGYRFAAGSLETLPLPDFADPADAPDVVVEGADARGGLYGRVDRSHGSRVPVRWSGDDVFAYEVPGQGSVLRAHSPSPSGELVVSAFPFKSYTGGWENEYGWEDEFPFLHHRDPARLFRFDRDGNAEQLPAAPLRDGPHPSGANAQALNDAGQVAFYESVGHTFLAFLYDPQAGISRLPQRGALGAFPQDIDASGRVIGFLHLSDNRRLPVLWERGGVRELELPSGTVTAGDGFIGESGVVIGTAYPADFSFREPYRWTAERGTEVLQQLVPVGSPFDLERTFGVDSAGRILARAERGGLEELVLLVPLSFTNASSR